MRVDGTIIVSMLAGALSALAGVLLIGWPGLPPLTGPLAVAAYALVAMPLLLLLATAAREDDSDLAGDRLVASGADADRAHRGPGELLDPGHVGAGVGRQLVERADRRQVLEPAR